MILIADKEFTKEKINELATSSVWKKVLIMNGSVNTLVGISRKVTIDNPDLLVLEDCGPMKFIIEIINHIAPNCRNIIIISNDFDNVYESSN